MGVFGQGVDDKCLHVNILGPVHYHTRRRDHCVKAAVDLILHRVQQKLDSVRGQIEAFLAAKLVPVDPGKRPDHARLHDQHPVLDVDRAVLVDVRVESAVDPVGRFRDPERQDVFFQIFLKLGLDYADFR